MPDTPTPPPIRAREHGDEDPINTIRDLSAWQFVWARAVARAWNDPEQSQSWTKMLFSENPAEVEQAFHALDFPLPLGFKLIVKHADPACQYDANAWKQVPSANGWAGQEAYLGASVVMYVPPRPADPTLAAIALTDYNANGQNYPFTF
ncbi:MAG: hypothetical protein ACOZE7_16610 [Pseudomonadota bacterium]